MFTPPTLEQKRLSHVTLALFPFDVVILYLWNSRLKDEKGLFQSRLRALLRRLFVVVQCL